MPAASSESNLQQSQTLIGQDDTNLAEMKDGIESYPATAHDTAPSMSGNLPAHAARVKPLQASNKRG
jgi:hypothetical protein